MSARSKFHSLLKASNFGDSTREAIVAEILDEHAHELAEKIRAKSHDLYGSPDIAHPNRPGELAGEFYGLLDAADLIDPEAQ